MINRNNYRQYKAYLRYLRDTAQLSTLSVGRYWFYGKHLLMWADSRPLAEAGKIKPGFASYLNTARLDGETGPLSPATLKKIVQTTRRFLTWAKANYPREFRALPATWIDELRPPRSVQSPHEHEFVTLNEVVQLVASTGQANDVTLIRDRAAAAMLFLSGMRANAFATLPIEAVDIAGRAIRQWPSLGVKTKNGKSATTYLLEIPELLAVVEKWDAFVRSHLPASAMWYTPYINHWGDLTPSVHPPGANRKTGVTKRLCKLFAVAGVPYKSPHKFRHGHAVYALQHTQTMADYKAVSMNLMHGDIRVTDGIYAPLAGDEVQRRIAGLTCAPDGLSRLSSYIDGTEDALTNDQLQRALLIAASRLAR